MSTRRNYRVKNKTSKYCKPGKKWLKVIDNAIKKMNESTNLYISKEKIMDESLFRSRNLFDSLNYNIFI